MAFVYKLGFWVGRIAGKGVPPVVDPLYWADDYAATDYVEGDDG